MKTSRREALVQKCLSSFEEELVADINEMMKGELLAQIGMLTEEDRLSAIRSLSDPTFYIAANIPEVNDKNGESEVVEQILGAYIDFRLAELPMRLESEALLMRNQERKLSENMQELIDLSEYVALTGEHRPVLTEESLKRSEPSEEIAAILSENGVESRILHSQKRIAALENNIENHGILKIRSAQRMVLLVEALKCLESKYNA